MLEEGEEWVDELQAELQAGPPQVVPQVLPQVVPQMLSMEEYVQISKEQFEFNYYDELQGEEIIPERVESGEQMLPGDFQERYKYDAGGGIFYDNDVAPTEGADYNAFFNDVIKPYAEHLHDTALEDYN